jgi:ABC-2 type transport system ATP-binding protein
MSQAVIKVDRLTKRFDDTAAVDAISFAVPAGTVAGLLGGNGAGKTTTISMLLGLLLPTSGTIEVLGVDMLRHRHRVLPRMNFSSPYVDLPHRLTVAENLTVYGHLYGLSRVRSRVAEIAEALDIGQFLKRPVGSLSAGQKTRVALAKALLNKPDVLLLDEPTAGFTPRETASFLAVVHEVRDFLDATIVMIDHDIHVMRDLVDRLYVLAVGRVIAEGPPSVLETDGAVRDVYTGAA